MEDICELLTGAASVFIFCLAAAIFFASSSHMERLCRQTKYQIETETIVHEEVEDGRIW